MLAIFLLLLLLMVVAMIYEVKTYNIHICIWIVGSVLSLLCNVLGWGIVSWTEGLLAGIVIYILLIVLYSSVSDAIGGGVLKGFIVIGIALGRYSVLCIINFIILWIIVKVSVRKPKIPGSELVCGALFLLLSVLLAWGEYYFIHNFLGMTGNDR